MDSDADEVPLHDSAPRNQRQRIMLEPLDNINQNIVAYTNEVLINKLMDDTVYDMNLSTVSIDLQVMRIITPSTNQKATIYSIYSNRQRSNTQHQVHFQRIYLCRVYSSLQLGEQSRLVYLMENSKFNNNLFDKNPEYRDNGVITIGTFVKIFNLDAIENRMSGDIPLISTHSPLIVMKRPSVLPSVHVIKEIEVEKSAAFVFNNRHLNLNQTYIESTSCGGNHCDKQRVSDWNRGNKGCGCFHMCQNISNLALVHCIWFHGMDSSDRVEQKGFSSTKFSLCYLKNRIPAMIQKSALQHTDAYFDIQDCISRVIDFVNENGGWTIVGWYKRGSIKDKSLIESGNASNINNDDTIVGSGQLSYHIVEVLPTNQDFLLDTALGRRLHELKYDVSGLNHA